MNRLFIGLYFDEDMDVLIARVIRAQGFHTITTAEAGNLGASDENQMAFANEQGLCIATHNRGDFEALATNYTLEAHHHCGVIIAARRPPYEVVRRLGVILNQVSTDEMIDSGRYI